MVCRQHLNIGPNLSVVADGDFYYVQHDAAEIYEDTRAETILEP